MYNVLLVDDDELDLEGLRRFINWRELDMEVTAAVTSGFTALQVLEKERIDVLVTDIKMPNLSGLELARRGLEKHPELKIVFISGHADFQYAKQAIALNASHYILKPFDRQEMVEVLQRTREELRRERERSERESVLHETIPYLKNDLMFRWLEGKEEFKAIAALMERFEIASIDYPAAVAIIEIDDVGWKLNAYSEEQRQQVVSGLFGKLLAFFQKNRIRHYCTIGDYRIALIIGEPAPDTMLEDWISSVKADSPVSITIGLGDIAKGPEAIPRSFREADEALGGKLFYGKCRLIRAYDKQPEVDRDTKDLNQILEQLFIAMTKYELLSIDDCISDLFASVKRLDGKLPVCHFLLHAISELNGHLHSLNEDFYKLLDMETNCLELIYHIETVDDMQSWLRRKAFEISEQLDMKKRKKNRKLIAEVRCYVDEQLGEDITLRQVASYFSFSPNYFGRMFKEETGMNFSDYVIAQRLERARRMLQNPKLKIFEVADHVGYNNITYFNRHFKEVYGMTPGEYRRQS
ncbi:response regulator [Paenibacillus sp. GCM10027626]|uniref:response regulator n=1 Tax=Paenibacillus sp. GCM10027626 TaxID=3273411 RepID=UPI003635E3DE